MKLIPYLSFQKSLAYAAWVACFACFAPSGQAAVQPAPANETQEERVIRLLGGVLQDLPVKLKTLKPEIRRLVFYEFRVDKNTIKPELKRVLQSMIETEITKLPQFQLATVPEMKPVKVIVTEDNFRLTRGMASIEEMRRLGEKHRVDAYVEADLFMSDKNLYVTITVVELLTGSQIWKEEFFTKDSEPIIKGYSAHTDLSVGLMFVPTTETKKSTNANPPNVTASATYYLVELRLTEPAFPSKSLEFVLKGGALILGTGVSFAGGGYAATGLRTGLIKKNLTEAESLSERANWLSAEANFGVIFPTGEASAVTLAGSLEVDLTRRFSLGGGITYFSPITIVSNGSTISVGGTVFQILGLKYYF